MRTPEVSVIGLRRSLIFRPIAILLLLFLVPTIPSVPAFQARADVPILVPSNRIIQSYCAGSNCYFSDLFQLETDAVNAYLALHKLPATDAGSVYDLGRQDLRDAIRGTMMSILAGIIATPELQRDTHQKALYEWLQSLVRENEIQLAREALSQFNAWFADPCHYKLDAEIASQYGISYNGTPFCFGGTISDLFGGGPTAPAESYFNAYGLKFSYGQPIIANPDFSWILTETSVNSLGVLATGMTIASAAISTGFALSEATAAIVPIMSAGPRLVEGGAAAAVTAVEATAQAAEGAAASVAQTASAVSAAVGPALIILSAILVGIQAGMKIIGDQLALEQTKNNLTAAWSKVHAPDYAPDLAAFLNDSTGLWKLQATFVAQTLPDTSSTAALPAHASTDLNFSIQTGASAAVSPTLQYKDWHGQAWSVQTTGGWFVQTCTSGATCPQADSITGDIRFVDGAGQKWMATRFGDTFAVSKGEFIAPTDQDCAVDSYTGVTPGTNFSHCKKYASKTITLKSPAGTLQTVSLSVLSPPVFITSANTSLPFTPTAPSKQTITASGTPKTKICFDSSVPSLPQGFTLLGGPNDGALNSSACADGSFELAFNGANLPNQQYQLTLSATNGTSSTPVKQTFTVDLSQHLGITSPRTISGTAGLPLNFKVTATGIPPLRLLVDQKVLDALPGITFTDHGDGTGTFSGTTPFPVQGVQAITCSSIRNPDDSITLIPCGLHVFSNAQGDVFQSLGIEVVPTLPPGIGEPRSANFVAGVPNSVLLTSTGAPGASVSWELLSAPSWLKLTNNNDGTATLSGTPPAGTQATFNPFVTPFTAGNVVVGNTFPIKVEDRPGFMSPNVVSFTVGVPGNFLVRANQGSISLSETPPSGLAFSPGNSLQCLLFNINGACLQGTPGEGTGGKYSMTLTADAGAKGTATQFLTLEIFEAAKVNIPDLATATLYTGTPGVLQVSATGYPSISTKPVPDNPILPTSPSEGKGMHFTVNGLPPSLQVSNRNPEGYATGTLSIKGTPPTAEIGTYNLEISATNGVGFANTKFLRLNIALPPVVGDVDGDRDVDQLDLNMVLAARNTPASGPDDPKDLDHNGVINVLDSRKLALLCTRPRCAMAP